MVNGIKTILNTVKDAFTFLKYGVAPTKTPSNLVEQTKQINHLASKKFYIAATSFIALGVFYFASVAILFLLPHQSEIIGGYVTIFTKTIEVLAIIIASYLGVQAAVDFKYGSSSTVSYEAPTSKEKEIQEATEKFQNVFINDPSYAPIEWSMKEKREQI